MSLPPRDFRQWMREVERKLNQAVRSGNSAAIQIINKEIDAVREEMEESGADARTPAAPIELIVQTAIDTDRNGQHFGRILVEFPDVTLATNGTALTIDSYELWGRDESAWDGQGNGPAWSRLDTSTVSTLSYEPVKPGAEWRIRVRAIGSTTTFPGLWSDEKLFTVTPDTTPPPIPSVPITTVSRGVVEVRWNGLDGTGAPMPTDFSHNEIAKGITGSTTTLYHQRLNHAGAVYVTGEPYNEPVYFRFRAVDTSGNKSAWSAAATVTPRPLVEEVDIAEEMARIEEEADARSIQLSDAALAAAKADATTKTDAAIAAAVAEAGTLSDSAKAQAISAAALDATEKMEQAEANAAAAALVIAKAEALREANEAEAAAKAYADLQASGASADVLAEAKTYADQQAEEARIAAETAAAADALAKTEAAEARAATDASDKADEARNAAVQAAAGDATQKAETARLAAIAAAATDATAKAEQAEADAAATAAADATTKANNAKAAAEAAAKTHADLVASGAQAAAIAAAATTAQQKADAAKTAAIAAAAADATAKKEQAEANAAADALTKANNARDAAIAAASTDATQKANAARDVALAELRELTGSTGRTWFQNDPPPAGATYSWAGSPYNSESIKKVDGVEVDRNLYPSPALTNTPSEYGWTKWNGAAGNMAVDRDVPAPWAKTGQARQFEWTAVAAGGESSGDIGLKLRHVAGVVGFGQPFTVHYRFRVLQNSSLSPFNAYSSVAGAATTIAKSRAATANFSAGEIVDEWATVSLTSAADTGSRLIAAVYEKAAGAKYELTDVFAYAGAHDPSYTFFYGGMGDDRSTDLWVDTNDGNKTYRWDTATDNWVAYEDARIQAAANATLAAAAADATTKSNAARDAALAEVAALAGVTGAVVAQPTQPADDLNGLWIDTANGNAPRKMSRRRALVYTTRAQVNAKNALLARGWTVDVITEIGSRSATDTRANYDLFVADEAVWAVTAGTFAQQCYDAGLAVFTTGNDTTFMPGMFVSRYTDRTPAEKSNLPVHPATGSTHPLTQGWAPFMETDNNYTFVPAAGVGVFAACTGNGFPDRPVGLYVENTQTTARRVHFQPSLTIAPATVLGVILDWLGSRWEFVRDASIQAAADAALAEAVSVASADATQKMEAAKTAAISAAAADATFKAEQAEANAAQTAAQDATNKANQARVDAIAAAETHADLVASGASADAIAAAALDATTKANNARIAAEAAAAADATSKMETAEANAAAEALRVATEKANAARDAAIAAAASDATSKANAAQTAAEAKAATAQAKADTAFANAATAQSKADTAFNDAATAAGIANGKGKVLAQTAAPGVADRNANTLWIDTTGNANTPKRWTTGTTWVAVTDKTATDAAAAAVTAKNAADTAKGVADTALANAATAQTAAGNAQSTANSAMTAANSKTRIYDSLSAPTGTGSQVGDYWHRWTTLGAGGKLLGSWRWDGNGWMSNALDATYLPLVDIGAGTFGALDGRRLQAKSVAAQSLVIADYQNLAIIGNMQDPGIRFDNPGYAGYSWVNDAATSYNSLMPWYMKMAAGTNSWATFRLGPDFAVEGGDKLLMEWYQKKVGATSTASMNMEIRNGTGGVITYDLRGTTPATSAAEGAWVKYVGIATVPDGGVLATPQFKLLTAGSLVGEWHFGPASLRRMSAGKLIVDGEITAEKLNIVSIDASGRIKSNAFEGGTFEGGTFTGTVFQTHLDSARGLKIDPAGLRMYPDTLPPAGETPPDPLIEFSPGGANRMVIRGTNGQVTIDDEGGVTAQALSSETDPLIMGQPLLGSLADYVFPIADRHESIVESSLLAYLPRGLVAHGTRDMSGINYAVAAEMGFLEVEFMAKAGRAYSISVPPVLMGTQTKTYYLRIRYTTDGSQPQINSPEWRRFAPYGAGTGTATTVGGEAVYEPYADQRVRMLLTVGASSEGVVFSSLADAARFHFIIQDIGVAIGFSQTDRYTFTRGTGATTTESKTERITYQTMWKADWMQSYRADGNSVYAGSGPANDSLMQGYTPYWAAGGRQTSMWGVTSGADSSTRSSEIGKTITAATAGATVSKIEVYMHALHWNDGSGGVARLHYHGQTSAPTTYPDSSSKPNYIGDYSFKRAQGRWITLPTSTFDSMVKDGSFRGIGLAPRGQTSGKYYGYMAWNGTTATDVRPKIRITYNK